MKKITRVLCSALALIFVLTLCACSSSKVKKANEFSDWFNLSLAPTYEKFVQAYKIPEGGDDAPSPNIALLLASDKYINCVFDYMKKGVQPDTGKITEENGVYTYSYGSFSQIFEFNSDTTSIKATMVQGSGLESKTEFIAIFSERNGTFYIQYITPDFNEYTEVKFTEKGGSVKKDTGCSELPYSIFNQDISKDFAK